MNNFILFCLSVHSPCPPYARSHTHTHTCTYTYTYVCTHTHTHTLTSQLLLVPALRSTQLILCNHVPELDVVNGHSQHAGAVQVLCVLWVQREILSHLNVGLVLLLATVGGVVVGCLVVTGGSGSRRGGEKRGGKKRGVECVCVCACESILENPRIFSIVR